MNSTILNRIELEANYIIKNNKTIRETAKKFKVSKSTIHKDLREKLKKFDYEKYVIIDNILKYHKEIRHIRGGQATKLRYLNSK